MFVTKYMDLNIYKIYLLYSQIDIHQCLFNVYKYKCICALNNILSDIHYHGKHLS